MGFRVDHAAATSAGSQAGGGGSAAGGAVASGSLGAAATCGKPNVGAYSTYGGRAGLRFQRGVTLLNPLGFRVASVAHAGFGRCFKRLGSF